VPFRWPVSRVTLRLRKSFGTFCQHAGSQRVRNHAALKGGSIALLNKRPPLDQTLLQCLIHLGFITLSFDVFQNKNAVKLSSEGNEDDAKRNAGRLASRKNSGNIFLGKN
jgi:predicted RNA-binding protein with PUA domain